MPDSNVTKSPVSSTDRLMFAMFIAIILHLFVVYGITFSAQEREPMASTLDVTLVGYKSNKAPKEADFLAQENQEGSGTLDEAKMQTTDVEAVFHANSIREQVQQERQASAPKVAPETPKQVITSTAKSPAQNRQEAVASTDTTPQELPEGRQQSLLQRSLEIASLQAKVDTMRQVYAKRPRVQRLTAASTMKSSDAYYVNSWRREVEEMGAMNYPPEAAQCFDNCKLRILVSIYADGTINELRVLESSGRKVLDDAAIRIVRLASPFAPFSEEMRRETDVLEIIRTWSFKGNRYISESE
ncbi:MAG: TonB family protein [Oleibacter sp.]|nr:TonB family protein [Thalassolituus sp.]